MARNKLAHLRHTGADFRRRIRQREPYDRVLIVCEGLTEKYYFEGLASFLNLSSANIRISPSSKGTDPVQVVSHAIRLAKDAEVARDAFQRVYCVFDLDRPYAPAISLAAKPGLTKTVLHVATSNPCFEIWLHLHCGYTDRSYVSAGNKTACDEVVDELLVHVPGYRKSRDDLFELFKWRVSDAIVNCRRLEADHRRTGSTNPSCNVHELAEYLLTLRGEKE